MSKEDLMYEMFKEENEVRKRAEEVLSDHMSDLTEEHIEVIPHLKGWIINAMVEFAEDEIKLKKMKINEVIEKLKGFQRLDVGIGYDMVSTSEDKDGQYVPWCEVEELINQLEGVQEKETYIIKYHSSYSLFDRREEFQLATDRKDALRKFWKGKNKEQWEIISITKNK